MKSITTNTPYFDPEIPKIAIVGRPNVGKSTLYNRLLGSRKSITDPTPGVTRDPVRSLWSLFGATTVLVDTGGLTESKEYLDAHITKKSLEAADEAKILVFVVDVEGLTPEDHEFVRRLRKLADRLILVVNKVDNHKRQQQVHEFHSLGFSPVIAVSAEHGEGVMDLLEEIARRLGIEDRLSRTGVIHTRKPGRQRLKEGRALDAALAAEEAEEDLLELDIPDDDNEDFSHLEALSGSAIPAPAPKPSPESALGHENKGAWDLSIAILGQPNTGKSTLTNLLTNSDISLVSPIAGTTRDVIEGSFRYKEKHFRILDTAGIRRKAKVHEDLEYYSVNRAIASVEEADVVFLMIDAEKGLSDQDKKIAAQIVKLGRGVILVVNKWDLVENGNAKTLEKVRDRMRFQFPVLSFAPIMAISAKTGFGVGDLLRQAIDVYGELIRRLDTGKLNNMLRKWVEGTPPPTSGGASRWKCRYITQASAHPLQFVLFVNRVSGFPDSYLGFLTNQLRRECHLESVPLKLTLRISGAR